MAFACRALLVVSVLMGSTPAANAQINNTFALGGQFGIPNATTDHARIGTDVGLTWRIGHGETGWGWRWSLNWFSLHLDQFVGPRFVELGELHVRPVMVGYGYRYVVNRVAVEGMMKGGYALTSMQLTPAAVDAYHDVRGAQSVAVDVTNVFVARPEVGMWVDLNDRIGVHVNAGYTLARPRMAIQSTLGEESRRLRADVFAVKFGIVYKIF